MAHLSNPLATADQLYRVVAADLPNDLQDSIRYATSRLTQAAAILLQVPQSIAAQAIVLLQRFLTHGLMQHEFADVSAAAIFLATKISMCPRSLRSVANVYGYLLSSSSALAPDYDPSRTYDAEAFFVSESTYYEFQQRVLGIEGQILNAVGFDTHVALPYAWAITYLQALDVIGPKAVGSPVAKRAVAYLNTALLSPQMVYLTQQPTTLAVAAIYLATRDLEVKLPDAEWWEVFDTDREDLGFLVLVMKSLEGWVDREREIWGKTVLTRSDIQHALKGR